MHKTLEIKLAGTRYNYWMFKFYQGVFGGIRNPGYVTDMDFVTIATTGNAQDFGDLTDCNNRGGQVAHHHQLVVYFWWLW